jgi:hypothetical protein
MHDQQNIKFYFDGFSVLDESLDLFILRNFVAGGRSFQPLMGQIWLSSCIVIKLRDAVIAYDEGFHECGIRAMFHFEICPGICCITRDVNGNSLSGYPISVTNYSSTWTHSYGADRWQL